MKNALMNIHDKISLRKRSIIVTVNDLLKNLCQIEHTRHRSVKNILVDLISGVLAYNLMPNSFPQRLKSLMKRVFLKLIEIELVLCLFNRKGLFMSFFQDEIARDDL